PLPVLPTVLLGLSVSPWPVGQPMSRDCPGCRGRKLATIEYCLICDAYGCQHLLPKLPRVEKPRPPEPDGLAGGLEGSHRGGGRRAEAGPAPPPGPPGD